MRRKRCWRSCSPREPPQSTEVSAQGHGDARHRDTEQVTETRRGMPTAMHAGSCTLRISDIASPRIIRGLRGSCGFALESRRPAAERPATGEKRAQKREAVHIQGFSFLNSLLSRCRGSAATAGICGQLAASVAFLLCLSAASLLRVSVAGLKANGPSA
jgi:hypothetical protein